MKAKIKKSYYEKKELKKEIIMQIIRYRNDSSEKLCKIFDKRFINNNPNLKKKIGGIEGDLCEYLSFTGILKIELIGYIIDMSYMFKGCHTLFDFQLNTKNVVNMSHMFEDCKFKYIGDNIKNWDTSNVDNMSYLFYKCSNLEYIPNIGNWNTKNVKNMSHMFDECINLKYAQDDLKNWDTSNVVDKSYMFSKCYKLEKLPALGNWNIANVKNMSHMFDECISLKEIPVISKWKFDEDMNLDYMFSNCYELKISENLLKKLKRVKKKKNIFYFCYELKNVPKEMKNEDNYENGKVLYYSMKQKYLDNKNSERFKLLLDLYTQIEEAKEHDYSTEDLTVNQEGEKIFDYEQPINIQNLKTTEGFESLEVEPMEEHIKIGY